MAIQTQTFTGGGTFTVPDCITIITIQAWGGGGGGSAGLSDGSQSGGGGGSGGNFVSNVATVTPGWDCPVDIGVGGISCTDGGYSRVRNPSGTVLALATGGKGAATGVAAATAAGADPSSLADCVGSTKRTGGYGGNGTRFGGGGGGSAAGTSANGGDGQDGVSDAGGAGGVSPGGESGAGGNGQIQSSMGDPGQVFGGGGGGGGIGSGGGGIGDPGSPGGLAANGLIIISWDDAPEVDAVEISAPGAYAIGSAITMTVTMSQVPTVVGTPSIAFTLGGQARQAVYNPSVSANRFLIFTYNITAADVAANLNGVTTGTAISLNGGTIRDGCSQNFDLTFSAVSQSGIATGSPFNFFQNGPDQFGITRTGFNPSMLGD